MFEINKNASPGLFSAPLKIAFGKGRGFHESLDFIKVNKRGAFKNFSDGSIPVYNDTLNNITLLMVRSNDMPWLLNQGHIDVAIGSSVWFNEHSFSSLDSVAELPVKTCRLSLIAKKKIPIRDINTIWTRFGRITKNYLLANALNAKITIMEGCHEAALALNMTDAIVDIIETGQTIRRMGFHELDCICTLRHEIWVRAQDDVTKEKLEKCLMRVMG